MLDNGNVADSLILQTVLSSQSVFTGCCFRTESSVSFFKRTNTSKIQKDTGTIHTETQRESFSTLALMLRRVPLLSMIYYSRHSLTQVEHCEIGFQAIFQLQWQRLTLRVNGPFAPLVLFTSDWHSCTCTHLMYVDMKYFHWYYSNHVMSNIK